jgi:hypothetical protein
MYFNIKDKINDEVRVFIFESLYFYERKNYKLDWVKEDLINYYNDNLSKLKDNLTKVFLRAVLFLNNEDTIKLAEALNNKFDNILNSDMELLLKLDYIVFFPKPLSILNTDEKFKPKLNYKNKLEKIEKFLMDNRKNDLLDDNIVCLLSNFSHYLEFRADILEAYIPIIYRLLSKFTNEFLIEIFFLYLQIDINKVVNIDMLKTFLKKIEEILQREKTIDLFIPEVSKEEIFYHDCKKQLEKVYKEFKEKHNFKDSDNITRFDELIKKATTIFPFASTSYSVELLEKIYNNYLKLLK